MRSREPVLDYIKSFCILYIVGFMHFHDYTLAFGEKNAITFQITMVVLGLFILISGYLVGKKQIDFNKKNIFSFYLYQGLKFYPPFVIALIFFDIFKIFGPLPIMENILLISMFLDLGPTTLWYIIMLLNFYLLVPYLLQLRKKPVFYCAFTLFIIGLLTLLYQFNPLMDDRLIVFFPIFAFGIFIADKSQKITSVVFICITLFALCSLAIPSYEHAVEFDKYLWAMPLTTFMPMAIFYSCLHYAHIFKYSNIIFTISSISYFLYVSHRIIYHLMINFWMPESDVMQILYLVFVCLPCVIGVSWAAKTLYDLFIEKVFTKVMGIKKILTIDKDE